MASPPFPHNTGGNVLNEVLRYDFSFFIPSHHAGLTHRYQPKASYLLILHYSAVFSRRNGLVWAIKTNQLSASATKKLKSHVFRNLADTKRILHTCNSKSVKENTVEAVVIKGDIKIVDSFAFICGEYQIFAFYVKFIVTKS